MKKEFIQTGRTEPVAYALYIGFFAGLFVSVIRLIAHSLNFTMFDNGFMISDWFINLNNNLILVELLGSISIIILSIAAALMYIGLFRTKRGVGYGIGFGVCGWLLLYIILPLIVSWPTRGIVMELETQVFEACLSIIWGLFIGYSIAFEFTDEASREPIYAK